ncbi:MgtC/SapB family protein [Photobacterium lipolyticum]|uniref:Uncharacterized protein n=1 Tax=Photobacterium lipolyticum TaxID=266810 RepID=A0A2T3N4R5_9GAMM|nr:MgtC/SapB family protein [Photobacterium lipolyticum]PSW07335.1 hypothetical protein C9I89_01045 [Photobacterium lipolyticum]
MDQPFDTSSPFLGLIISLLLGAIIGTQRGWVYRNEAAGSRVAGIRTYALIGLMGGISGLLALTFSELIFAFSLIALAVVIAVSYVYSQNVKADLSITGLIGMLITFMLGSLAVVGEPVIAASAAVITALILDNKKELHDALKKLQAYELDATLRFLLISVVMLPLLPNQGFGPWQAINPYEIWWMVVLIAGISFVGYFAIKISGPEKGILFTCLFAGLSSSTALTIQFSNLSKKQSHLSGLLASGILISCGTMFPRILFVCSVVNRQLVELLWLPMLLMMASFYLPAWWIWRHNKVMGCEQPQVDQNPLILTSALFFGLVLLLIMLLSHALQEWFGNAGVLLLSAASGITDVDAITLALGRQSKAELLIATAGLGIFIAAAVNSLVKMGMALTIGSKALGKYVVIPVISSVLLGGGSIWLIS